MRRVFISLIIVCAVLASDEVQRRRIEDDDYEDWEREYDDDDSKLIFGFGGGCRRVKHHQWFGLRRVEVGKCSGSCKSGRCRPVYQMRRVGGRTARIVVACRCSNALDDALAIPQQEDEQLDAPNKLCLQKCHRELRECVLAHEQCMAECPPSLTKEQCAEECITSCLTSASECIDRCDDEEDPEIKQLAEYDDADALLFSLRKCHRSSYHKWYGLRRVNVGECKGRCPGGALCESVFTTRRVGNRDVPVVDYCRCAGEELADNDDSAYMNDEDQALPEKTYLREDDDDDDDEEEERRDVEDEEGKDEALFSIFRRKPCRRVSNWKGHGVNRIDVGKCSGSCPRGTRCTPKMSAQATRGGWMVMVVTDCECTAKRAK